MARVPDLFEDLKNCFGDSDECVEHLSLSQNSFYDGSNTLLEENRLDKLVALGTSEASKTSPFTIEDSMVVVSSRSAGGKILKKRLVRSRATTTEDLRAFAQEPEEEMIPWSVPRTFQSRMSYIYKKILREQLVLTDALHQSITRESRGQNLRATSLNDLNQEVKFDMSGYISEESFKFPVTLRISQTRLFVSAQNEDEPVLLKEMPETPRVITGSEASLVFFWENLGSKHYFTSAAHPELFIATRPDSLVHLARGPPSITDFEMS